MPLNFGSASSSLSSTSQAMRNRLRTAHEPLSPPAVRVNLPCFIVQVRSILSSCVAWFRAEIRGLLAITGLFAARFSRGLTGAITRSRMRNAALIPASLPQPQRFCGLTLVLGSSIVVDRLQSRCELGYARCDVVAD